MRILVGASVIGLGTGCSTMKESMLTGMGVGAVTGAVASSRSGNGGGMAVVTGSMIGAAIGGIGGHIVHGSLEKRDAKVRKKTLLNLDKFSVSKPLTPPKKKGGHDFKLSSPDVDKECFDWEVRGKRLVEKHCVWTIKGSSFWTQEKR